MGESRSRGVAMTTNTDSLLYYRTEGLWKRKSDRERKRDREERGCPWRYSNLWVPLAYAPKRLAYQMCYRAVKKRMTEWDDVHLYAFLCVHVVQDAPFLGILHVTPVCDGFHGFRFINLIIYICECMNVHVDTCILTVCVWTQAHINDMFLYTVNHPWL